MRATENERLIDSRGNAATDAKGMRRIIDGSASGRRAGVSGDRFAGEKT